MSKVSNLAVTLAALPIVAVSATAVADSPGQLTGGSNVLVVKNVTQNGSYDSSAVATCNDVVKYSVRLHNAMYGGLTNVVVKADLAGSVTATPAEGASAGTTGTAKVTVTNGTIALVNGSTQLYDQNGNVIKTLPDTITSAGVNAGNIAGSTTEFVNFEAKVSCPTPPAPVYTCDLLKVTPGDNRTVSISAFNVTAKNGATFKNADIAWGDNSSDKGLTTIVGKSHQYAADGTYTIAATANFDVNGQSKSATSAACEQVVTFKANTPPTITTPATPAAPSELVNTGAGNVAGIFAAVTAAAAAAYRFSISRRLSRQ